MVTLMESYINTWFDENTEIASSLLAILSTGLTLSYVILIYNLFAYFRYQMRNEMYRLTLLFATFVLCYVLRMIFQIGLSTDYYITLIDHLVTRWALCIALPLLWDITSLVSILVLHFKSFSKKEDTHSVPQAGHYNEQGGIPTVDGLTWSEVTVSSSRGTFQDIIEEEEM